MDKYRDYKGFIKEVDKYRVILFSKLLKLSKDNRI